MATIPSVEDFENGKRDLDDLAKLANENTVVTTRYGENPKKSYSMTIDELKAQFQVNYVTLNPKGYWTTGTDYLENDLWQINADDTWVRVLKPYTSSTSETIDLASGNVEIWQGLTRRNGVQKISSVFDTTAFANLQEGDIAELVEYHPNSGVGGGPVIVRSARHNGGTSISLTRARPETWSGTDLTDWFADSGVNELCAVRNIDSSLDLRWFGAKGDGETDDTEAIQSTIDFAASFYTHETTPSFEIVMSNGTFMTNGNTIGSAMILLKGNGVFKALPTCSPAVLTMSLGGSEWNYSMYKIEGIMFDGSDVTEGFRFGQGNGGRMTFERCTFSNCTKGINKLYGSIGNAYNRCSFTKCEYGYFAVDYQPTMHLGVEVFNQCNFDRNSKSAVYVKGNASYTANGQFSIRDSVIENNQGYAIFIDGFKAAAQPFLLDQVWFEGNASLVSVDIEGYVNSPVNIHVNDCSELVINNNYIPTWRVLGATNLLLDNVYFSNAVYSIPDTSSCTVNRGRAEFSRLVGFSIDKTIATGEITCVDSTTRPMIQTREGKHIFGYSFSDVGSYGLNSGMTQTQITDDSTIFDSCVEITIPPSLSLWMGGTSTNYVTFPDVIQSCVWTIDIKIISGSLSKLAIADGLGFVGNVSSYISEDYTGRWLTISGIDYQIAQYLGNGYAYFTNGSASENLVFRLGGIQIVSFENAVDAERYYNGKKFNITKG